MATRTTSQAGNWSSSSTWGGSAAPGNGDTAVVNHDVTVDVNTTVGTSPSDQTTMAITIAAGKAVTVDAGVTLVVRGNVTSAGNTNGGIVMSAGSVWEWDASQATTTTTRYKGILGTGFVGTGRFTINGSSGSPCVVRSNAGGGNGQFTFTNSHYAIVATYTTFLRLGDNGTGNTGINCGGDVTMSNCTFDACGLLEFSSVTSFKNFTDCVWQNSNPVVDAGNGVPICVKIRSSDSAGTKSVTRCTFDMIASTGGNGMSWIDNYFWGRPFVGSGTSNWAAWTGNIIVHQGSAETFAPIGPITDSYFLADNTTGNQHFVATNAPDQTYDGLVFEYPHPYGIDGPDPLYGNMGAATVIRVLVIPSISDGCCPNNIVNTVNAHLCSITHCTIVGIGAKLVLNEAAPTQSQIAVAKSSLISAPGASGDERAAVDLDISASPPTFVDVIDPAGATCNYLHNYIPYTHPVTGLTHDGFKCRLTAAPTGNIFDNTTGPQFVDSTRCASNYAVYKGWASSGDTLRQKLDALHTALKATPSLVRSEMIPWIRAGFATTNPALRYAAHDGTTIGACGGSWSDGATTNARRVLSRIRPRARVSA